MATEIKFESLQAILNPRELLWKDANPGTAAVDITYSFMTSDDSATTNFVAFSEAQKNAARQAFQLWQESVSIRFTEVATGGGIQLGTSAQAAGVGGSTQIVENTPGDGRFKNTFIRLNNAESTNLDQTPGARGFYTLLQQIGRSLGLKSAGNTGDGTPPPYLPAAEDNFRYTLMSDNNSSAKYTGSAAYPQTPLLYDTAALQLLYDVDLTVRIGNDVYKWEPNQNFIATIWDVAGNDTIDASNQTQPATISLVADSRFPSSIGSNNGAAIKDNLTLAYSRRFSVEIENAIGGSGNDLLFGNGLANRLQGNGGDDILRGNAGADTFVFKSTNEGVDVIEDFNQREGDKILFEAPVQPSQFRYAADMGEIFFDNKLVVLLAKQSTPTAFSLDTDLKIVSPVPPVPPAPSTTTPPGPTPPGPVPPGPAPLEQTVPPPLAPPSSPLVGTEGDDQLVSQSDQGITIQGLGGNDRITGGAGNDIINGGTGNDTMSGSLGDDSYTVDSSADVVIEAINAGNDTVFAPASYILPSNVENLTLTGDNAINGNGNGLNNVVAGNAADNYLYGGDGNDQMNGLAGKDYLYGQAGNDVLNGGEDEDWLVGDLGDDVLNGGAGNDRMLGGAGNDTLAGDQGRNRLTGGADADRFVLIALDQNFDIITDFKAAQGDRITVSVEGMGKQMKRGKLSADQFTLGSTTNHDKAGFVYSAGSGRLFFDADGMGGQKQVQIAKLASGTALSSSNILIGA